MHSFSPTWHYGGLGASPMYGGGGGFVGNTYPGMYGGNHGLTQRQMIHESNRQLENMWLNGAFGGMDSGFGGFSHPAPMHFGGFGGAHMGSFGGVPHPMGGGMHHMGGFH
jgi:hypothetical protein